MTLGTGDYVVIAGLLATIVGVPLTLVVANLRSLAARVDRTDERIDHAERRIAEINEAKVDKREWLRVEHGTRQKVDGVAQAVSELSSKLEAEWGMAAAMNRVAEGITRIAEGKHAD